MPVKFKSKIPTTGAVILLALAKQAEPENLKKGIIYFNPASGIGQIITDAHNDYEIKDESLLWAKAHQQEWATLSNSWQNVITQIYAGKLSPKRTVLFRKLTPGLVLLRKRFEGGK